MLHCKQTLPILIFLLFAGCAHKPAPSETASNDKTTPTKQAKNKNSNTKQDNKTAKEDGKPEGEIIGVPASGSKFAKLKLGMSQDQVKALIGPADDDWSYPTAKMAIPFYFGDDRWEYGQHYNKEGDLIFAGHSKLIRITVDKSPSSKSKK